MLRRERSLHVRQCATVLVPRGARARRARAVLLSGVKERHAALRGVVTQYHTEDSQCSPAHSYHDLYKECYQWNIGS